MTDALPVAPPVFDVRIAHTVGDARRTFRLDLAFRTGARRTVLIGPSGSGKTLTLQAIAGLLVPASGRIAFGGQALFDATAGVAVPARARRFGVVFQDYALFPHLTVRQNVAFGLVRGWRNPSAREVDDADGARVEAVLRRLELAPMAHQRPHELSGGQRQRTALARALVIEPCALLLDEPFAALDPALRGRLRDELDALLDETGVPMLMITHDPADRERFGASVLAIADGRIVGERALEGVGVGGPA
jgi:molybdate transport system ATP-binding protein